jgi:hypothetical protein
MDNVSNAATKQHIQERLGPLIRCQYISQYWLLLSVLSDDAGSMPLAQLRPQLKQLLTVRSAKVGAADAEVHAEIEDAPPSWILCRRSTASVSTVQLTWELDIGALREVAQHCAAAQKKSVLTSPGVTAPLGGMAFEMQIACEPEEGSSAVKIGVFAGPRGIPSDGSWTFTYSLEVPGILPGNNETSDICHTADGGGWGFYYFFDIGFMEAGWDEVAWAAQGLPASGPLVLKLSVSKVGHMADTGR